MTETYFKMIYASGQQFGKAMAQAKELAERARNFTAIEITVVPHPDLAAKDKRISALEADNAKLRVVVEASKWLLQHVNRDHSEWKEPLEKALAALETTNG